MSAGGISPRVSQELHGFGAQLENVPLEDLRDDPAVNLPLHGGSKSTCQHILERGYNACQRFFQVFQRRRAVTDAQGEAHHEAAEDYPIQLDDLDGDGHREPLLPLAERAPHVAVSRVDLVALFRSVMHSVIVEERVSVATIFWFIILAILLVQVDIYPLILEYIERGVPSQAWLRVGYGVLLAVSGSMLALMRPDWDVYHHVLIVLLVLAVVAGWLSWLDRTPPEPPKI